MEIIHWCICALVMLSLIVWWNRKQKNTRREISHLLLIYINVAQNLAQALRTAFTKAIEGTASETDEEMIEELLNEFVKTDCHLRQKITCSWLFLTPRLIKTLKGLLYNEGNLRHITPKELEKYVGEQSKMLIDLHLSLTKNI